MNAKFYLCERCGNLIFKIKDSGMKPYCCGAVMSELFPEHVDGTLSDKHVPVIECEGKKVHITIGKEIHPFTEEHHIEWVYVQTDKGGYLRYLNKTEEPKTCIEICEGEKIEAVYAYCNIHGLWVNRKCVKDGQSGDC